MTSDELGKDWTLTQSCDVFAAGWLDPLGDGLGLGLVLADELGLGLGLGLDEVFFDGDGLALFDGEELTDLSGDGLDEALEPDPLAGDGLEPLRLDELGSAEELVEDLRADAVGEAELLAELELDADLEGDALADVVADLLGEADGLAPALWRAAAVGLSFAFEAAADRTAPFGTVAQAVLAVAASRPLAANACPARTSGPARPKPTKVILVSAPSAANLSFGSVTGATSLESVSGHTPVRTSRLSHYSCSS